MANGLMRRAPPSPLGSDFDAFLFAPIGEEGSGMPLSVLSALARQDVDPWQEAAHLARLPAIEANRRLRLRIEALPGRASTMIDPAMLATRLLELLPSAATPPKPDRPASNYWIAFYVTAMAVVMCAEYISANHATPSDGLNSKPSPSVSDHASSDKNP